VTGAASTSPPALAGWFGGRGVGAPLNMPDLMDRLDNTLPLAIRGYAWLPNRLRRRESDVLRTRLLGQPAIALRGPQAARWFYDEQHIRRHGAIPEPVRGTLFGRVPCTLSTARRIASARPCSWRC
jgi:hypothetical protein